MKKVDLLTKESQKHLVPTEGIVTFIEMILIISMIDFPCVLTTAKIGTCEL